MSQKICLKCGKQSEHLLCSDCRTENVLDDIYKNLSCYDPEDCSNENINLFVESFDNIYEARKVIPEILELFSFDIAEYYYCRYYRLVGDTRFEDAAIRYLDSHYGMDIKQQWVLYELLDYYLRDDFVKPVKWCKKIISTTNLCWELYYIAGQFFAMVADYDLADQIICTILEKCNDLTYNRFLFYSRETAIERCKKLKDNILYYRTKRPYWPSTEARRKAVAAVYDEKGIKYPKSSTPYRVREKDFSPLEEYLGDAPKDYCSFWCSAVPFQIFSVKVWDVYEIAAVKVRQGKIDDCFQSYIKPWDGGDDLKEAAAKEAGIGVKILDDAENVYQVMKKFFKFVESDILVCTDALRNQGNLISRAARYSGMRKIKNLFLDLLDYAADVSEEFDLQNNTREFLIDYFNLTEGKSALEKAKCSVSIFEGIKKVEKL